MRGDRQPEPTPLPTQHIYILFEKMAFDHAACLHGEIEYSKVKCSASSGNRTHNIWIVISTLLTELTLRPLVCVVKCGYLGVGECVEVG
jgi:hypothetical protein